jgi:DNA-binding GntR family transcriptional regulator
VNAMSEFVSDRLPRDPGVSLSQWVYEQLSDMIIAGDIPPGVRIGENRVAQTLGTSRVPVREALQRLADDGWVERVPRSGARVRVPTSADVAEVFSLRLLLEAEAVRLAVQHISLADAEVLREIVNRGFAAYEHDDKRAMVETNSEFHSAVAELSRNRLLCRHLSMIDRSIKWLFGTIAAGRGGSAVCEHLELVEAMIERRTDDAVAVIIRHIEATQEVLTAHWASRA